MSSSRHSGTGIDALPQLDISSPSIALGETGGFILVSDKASSTQKGHQGFRGSAHEDEEGVLLQPDFEFDEDGNIVDLAMNEPSIGADQQSNLQPHEHPVRGQVSADVGEIMSYQQQVNERRLMIE